MSEQAASAAADTLFHGKFKQRAVKQTAEILGIDESHEYVATNLRMQKMSVIACALDACWGQEELMVLFMPTYRALNGPDVDPSLPPSVSRYTKAVEAMADGLYKDWPMDWPQAHALASDVPSLALSLRIHGQFRHRDEAKRPLRDSRKDERSGQSGSQLDIGTTEDQCSREPGPELDIGTCSPGSMQNIDGN
ncbi:hypothetical protein BDW62DRAFT_200162 [Aspergillus aurantiobrunneus]